MSCIVLIRPELSAKVYDCNGHWIKIDRTPQFLEIGPQFVQYGDHKSPKETELISSKLYA